MPTKCTESVIGEGGLCQGNDSFHWNSGGSWSSGISFPVQTCLISELVPEDNSIRIHRLSVFIWDSIFLHVHAFRPCQLLISHFKKQIYYFVCVCVFFLFILPHKVYYLPHTSDYKIWLSGLKVGTYGKSCNKALPLSNAMWEQNILSRERPLLSVMGYCCKSFRCRFSFFCTQF